MNPPRSASLVIWSILLGVLGFVFSVIVIRSFLNQNTGNVQLILSDHTEYIHGVNGERDTLFLLGKQEYLVSMAKEANVEVVQLEQNDSSFQGHRSAYFSDYGFQIKADSSLNVDSLERKLRQFIINQEKQYEAFLPAGKHFFNRNPRLLGWLILISIAVGFSCFMIPVFLLEILHYSQITGKKIAWMNLLPAVALIVALFLPQMLGKGGEVLVYPMEVHDVPSLNVPYCPKVNKLRLGIICQ
ncbi:MAG: hypothetical protein AAF206_13025 [Bacteroidota bacterium]